jgi:hypothetical protein
VESHRDEFEAAAVSFALVALVPRLAVVTQVPAYFRPRGVVLYVVLFTLWLFVVRQWWGPWSTAVAAQHDRDWEELSGSLGRRPTREEFLGRRRELRRARKSRRR